MLRLHDDWVWDSWVADDGERFHLLFLQAPRALEDPLKRHTRATIGHATSTDLVDWDYLGTALLPSLDGWDDLALWTGSTVRGDDGVWRMFYTALSTQRGHVHRDQRVGLAESDDLSTWARVGDRPLVVPDGRWWYATLPEDPGASETWRDPFVFRDPDGYGWHMLVTARLQGAPRLDDGALGHARSHDLRTWEVQPPLSGAPSGFGQLEVAQVRVVDDRPVLVFTCHPDEQSPDRVAEHGAWCTWSIVGEPGGSLLGPWDLSRAVPFEAEPTLFAAPLVQRRDGSWALLGFRNQESEGIVSLDIVDPITVGIVGNGLQAL